MANEIVPIFALTYTPTLGRPTQIPQFTEKTSGVTQSSTQKAVRKTVTIPTSDTVVSLSELTTLGKLYVENKDTVNFVDLGATSGGAIVPMVRLKAGEFAWLRLKAGITLRAQADTASVDVEFLALND